MNRFRLLGMGIRGKKDAEENCDTGLLENAWAFSKAKMPPPNNE